MKFINIFLISALFRPPNQNSEGSMRTYNRCTTYTPSRTTQARWAGATTRPTAGTLKRLIIGTFTMTDRCLVPILTTWSPVKLICYSSKEKITQRNDRTFNSIICDLFYLFNLLIASYCHKSPNRFLSNIWKILFLNFVFHSSDWFRSKLLSWTRRNVKQINVYLNIFIWQCLVSRKWHGSFLKTACLFDIIFFE